MKVEKFEMPEEDLRYFSGREIGPDRKYHNVSRTTCNKCGEVLSQMHYNCCGYSSCGFGRMGPHKCAKKPKKPKPRPY